MFSLFTVKDLRTEKYKPLNISGKVTQNGKKEEKLTDFKGKARNKGRNVLALCGF